MAILTFGDAKEKDRRNKIVGLLKTCPIPEEELLHNVGLFLTPQTLSRVLFMDFLYRKVLEIQGCVMEFGCRWGQNSVLFSSMRGIYEPFNRLRKVVAFDTFEGHIGTTGEDHGKMAKGMYSVTSEYDEYLRTLMQLQEGESPLAHLKKHEVVKGDASATVGNYLERNPETIIALAYFDMDLYQPTVDCLRAIKDRLTIGSVIGFDELNDPVSPGETLALKEVLGLGNVCVRRYPHYSRASYLVIGEH